MAPLRLFFLWHFHQPWYVDFAGKPAPLPWVRLHALKDYADLPRLLSEEPRVPHVANLVPALLDQIELLAGGGTDLFLDIARQPAEEWDAATRRFVVTNFFSVHPRAMAPFPGFVALAARQARALKAGGDALDREFSSQELRDLVVWFHLAWEGERLSRDHTHDRLRRHGARFSEATKDELLARQAEFLPTVLPAWKEAFASGVVEAATSPYHHPIQPLLVTSLAAREALPKLPLPHPLFSRPEDARAQLSLGLATFDRHFGFRPAGMWPPEGSLSEAALRLMAEAGVRWAASDEDVLLGSLPAGRKEFGSAGSRARAIFRPYRLSGGASPTLFFRDRLLSDRIGFSYATWTAAEAAADFVARLRSIHEAAPGAGLVVPVILDGENAWESYPENGAPFLRTLAAALAREAWIEVTTPSRVLSSGTAPAPLDRLTAGSWIGASFTTWIGHPSKNRAWELLSHASETLGRELDVAPVVSPLEVVRGHAGGPAAARAAFLAAEASDWFWWFGDDHSSAQDPIFDALFRSHLSGAYRCLGHEVPAALAEAVERGKGAVKVFETAPVSPTIDGARPDFFEWLGAARYTSEGQGAMSRSAGLVKQLLFGTDAAERTLYLRLDPATPPASTAFHGMTARLQLPALPEGSGVATFDVPLGGATAGPVRAAVDRIVELAAASTARDGIHAFRLVLLDAAGHELEAFPPDGFVRFRRAAGDWSA